MLKKSVIAVAVMAAVCIPMEAFAKPMHAGHGKVSKGGHGGHVQHMNAGKGGHHAGHGHHHSHARHFWHGRWWAYGVGSCWNWSVADDEYIWVCD